MTALAETAVRYAAHGWHVFPLAPRGKLPLIGKGRGGRGYKDATTDAATVAAWWRETPDANIGLWPGPSGLVIIDIDGPEGAASALHMGFLGVETARVQTGRADGGRHLYYRHPGFHVSNSALAPHLDVRGDAGYVVLPPSVHPTGAVYTWGGVHAIAELPAQALAMLKANQGTGATEDTRSRDLAPPAAWTPPTSWRDADALNRRVRAYLDTVGQVGEGARNSTAFRVAAWLVRDVALTGDVAWCYLREWNDGNAPPLGTRELRACLTSALQHGRRTVGSGLHREAIR